MKTSEKDIIAWLNHYDIRGYTLKEDAQYGLVVDVEGSVDLRNKFIDSIAVKFDIVGDSFDCSFNDLKSLEGCPRIVKNFYCSRNKLVSLAHSPDSARHYDCSSNSLTSLVGATSNVDGCFDCGHNQLTSLMGSPVEVFFYYSCRNNKLESLVGMPQYVGVSAYCDNNNLKNLDGLAEYIGKSISLDNNPLLGGVQEKSEFYEVKQIYDAEREKGLLSGSIVQSTSTASFKI